MYGLGLDLFHSLCCILGRGWGSEFRESGIFPCVFGIFLPTIFCFLFQELQKERSWTSWMWPLTSGVDFLIDMLISLFLFPPIDIILSWGDFLTFIFWHKNAELITSRLILQEMLKDLLSIEMIADGRMNPHNRMKSIKMQLCRKIEKTFII